MADQGAIWQWLIDAIDASQAVALLIATETSGSTPGKAGAKMAVTVDACIGTIGGGLIESSLMKTARAMLIAADTGPKLMQFAHHASKTVHPSGMICGGEQTVLIYCCAANDRASFAQLLQSCLRRRPLSLFISAQGLQVLPPMEDGFTPEFVGGQNWHYREIIGHYKRAYIIGAGHVGLALSKVLAMLDFDISVIDDREPLDSMAANVYGRQQWGIAYADIAGHVPEGMDVFAFIMTHNHHGDELVLSKLAGKRLAYLGVLGSRHKVAELKNRLAQHVSFERLQRLHAPMGLPIGSHTPVEIAISIAAELIQIINTQRGD